MSEKILATNRKAYHDYFIEERIEAGISLLGSEVKSIRQGRVNLQDSFARVENGELWLHHMHISPYEQANLFNHDPLRKRKILLHKTQISRLTSKTQEKGFTLVPLRLYLQKSYIKVELGLCKGKKLYDKREAIAEKTAKREIERIAKQKY